MTTDRSPRRWAFGTLPWRVVRRWLVRLVAAYVAAILVGLYPVNRDFRPPADGIEIGFLSNSVHSDIVLPLEAAGIAWRQHFPADHFLGETQQATHVAIGWGNRAFYLETPRWRDLRANTVAQALFWPSPACVHVTYVHRDDIVSLWRTVRISEDQYQRLSRYILDSLVADAAQVGAPIPQQHYGEYDAFYHAHGRYHLLNTCNNWLNRAMQRADLPTGLATPLPYTPLWYLPESPATGNEPQTR